MYNLDPATIRMHIAQPFDPYSDMKNLGNLNKDSARFFTRAANRYAARCIHEYLQDLGISYSVPTTVVIMSRRFNSGKVKCL